MREMHTYIEKPKHRRRSNKVLHAYPFSLFWLERNMPVKELMIERMAANAAITKQVNLNLKTMRGE